MTWLAQSNRPASGDKWEERVSRRLQRIADALNKDLTNGLEYGRLHRTLASLENEMLSRKDAGMTTSTFQVSSLSGVDLQFQKRVKLCPLSLTVGNRQ